MKSFFFFFNRKQQRKRENKRKRRGVVAVETALCMIFVLLPVTLGGFQFALVFMTQHALQQVAREGARFAAVRYGDDGFNGDENQGTAPNSLPSLKYILRKHAVASGFAWKEIDGTVLPGNIKGDIVITPDAASRVSGQPITITISYPMQRRALLGSLFFKSADGKIAPLQLGFLNRTFSATSTTLME